MNFKSEPMLREVDGEMALYGLTDKGLGTFKTKLRPYGFILEDDYRKLVGIGSFGCDFENTSLKAKVNGLSKNVIKFSADNPNVIGKTSHYLENKGIKVFEGDIRYVRRVFIDKVFGMDYKNTWAYVDLEVDDAEGYKGYGESKIVACSVGFSGVIETFINEGEEKDFIDGVIRFLKRADKTVIVGWNVEYDMSQLKARASKLGVDARWLDICYGFDLRDYYRKTVKGLSSYSLYEVSKFENLTPKLIGKKICNMTKEELRDYNRRDVEILMQLDDKHGFVSKELYLMEVVGLPLSMSSTILVGDTLVLRRMRELGYVARNNIRRAESDSYRGAYIREPKGGIYSDVAVIDAKSLYPSVVMYNNIDIEGFNGEIVPQIINTFMVYKDDAEKRGDKVSREIYKLLMNKMYGLFGTSGFRFYDRKKAEKITEKAREVLTKMLELVEGLGLEVLYGDTDSCFFKADSVEKLSGVIDYVNENIKPYEVKLEHRFSKILIFSKETGGAKKRYVGIEQDGKLFVRGVEMRRGDWCMLAKNVLRDAVKIVFDAKSPEDAVREIDKMMYRVKAELYAGKHDLDLVITKSVRTQGYKVKTPQYEAWKKAVMEGKIPKESVEVSYYFKNGGKVEPVVEGDTMSDIDYKTYWVRQIKPPIERLIKSVVSIDRGVQITL